MSEESVLASETAEADVRELPGLKLLPWPTKINFFSSNVQVVLNRKQRLHAGFCKSQPFFLDLQLTQPLVVRTPCILSVAPRTGISMAFATV